MNGWMAVAMGHYSHVLSAGSGTTSSRAPRRLRLLDVSVMAMRAEVVTIAFWRAVIAECLASLLLVLFGCLATLTCPGPRDSSAHTLLVALCFGLTVASLVQCFQHISGAHLNPVVSLVQVVTCKVTPLRALLYALAQTGGAVAGASILHGITTGSCQAELGATVLHYGLSPWQGMGIEILLTFLLVFTLCATNDPNRAEANNQNNSNNKAMVVGLAVAGCHLAGYRFTGSSMNPARSLGPAFVAGNWKHHWIYWAGPTLGGVAAGLLYEFIFDPSRTRSRSHLPASPDAEDGMATTSLTTANPAHLPSSHPPPASASSLAGAPRHYYCNSGTPALTHHSNHHYHHPHPGHPSASSANLLGSPRPSRREPPPFSPSACPNVQTLGSTSNAGNHVISCGSGSSSSSNSNSSSNTTFHKSAGGLAFSPIPTSSTSPTTTTPNHYVPGTYGDRSLFDVRGDHLSHNPLPRPPSSNNNSSANSNNPINNNSDDLFAPIPPIPRRGDVRAVTYAPPPPPQRRHGGVVPQEDVSPGRENQAYTFDSNPRRLQPSSPLSHPTPQPSVLNLFDDGRESICLSDVRVF